MVNVIGFDVGGANTKAAFVKTGDGDVEEIRTVTEYFPVWKMKREQLPALFKRLRRHIATPARLDGVGVTMTAELADIYSTKSEGVTHILSCIEKVFVDTPLFVLDVEANLQSIEDAKRKPLDVAAANWAATGWMVSRILANCIVIDVGSTTTSIIPVIGGKIGATGKTDLEKLQNGELVYTGTLRTNIATITSSIPIRDRMTKLSSELFAQSGDVHLILGNIKSEEYVVETMDGQGKTMREAMARLARVICADIDMLTEQEIVTLAKHVCDKQIGQIAEGLRQVYDRIEPCFQHDIPVVVTGLGRECLAKKAALRTGFNKIIDLADLLGTSAASVSTSVGVALMVATKLGEKIFDGSNHKGWRKFSQ